MLFAACRFAGATETAALAVVDRELRPGAPPLSKATWRRAMKPYLREAKASVLVE